MDALVDACLESIRTHSTCSSGGHCFRINPEGYDQVLCSLPDEDGQL